jgi:hypothetical protein
MLVLFLGVRARRMGGLRPCRGRHTIGGAVESILYNLLNMIQWGNREAKAVL